MHTHRLTPISCDTYLRGSENEFIRVFFFKVANLLLLGHTNQVSIVVSGTRIRYLSLE